jgi:hydroxymethylpyrimidine pyrophosphatase-like HAD family hydrolase
MSETPEVFADPMPERSPLWSLSRAAAMLSRQVARGWTPTAFVSDYNNSWFRPDGLAETRTLAGFAAGHDIPTIIVTGNGFDQLTADMDAHGLPRPEVVIGAVGTEIHVLTPRPDGTLAYVKDGDFDAIVASRPFDRHGLAVTADAIMHPAEGDVPWELTFQVPDIERAFLDGAGHPGHQPYKLSFYAMATDDSRTDLERYVRDRFPGTGVAVCEEIGYNSRLSLEDIKSGRKKRYCIDLLPITPKAAADNYVADRLGIRRAASIGDSGNDATLYTATDVGYGIIVGGHTPELPGQVIDRFPHRLGRHGLTLVYEPDGAGGFRRRKVFYAPDTATRAAGTVLEAVRTWLTLVTPMEPSPAVRRDMEAMLAELSGPAGAAR